MHRTKSRWLLAILGVLAIVLLINAPASLFAQDSGTLRITGTDVSRIPTVVVYIDGRDANGAPLDLSNQYIDIKQGDQRIVNPQVIGLKPVGTFTVFLLDLTAGVQTQVPDIQSVIEAYAASPTMEEHTDAVAIYRVDEISAVELLAPTEFHNSIRNTFAAGIEPTQTSTALYNSLGDMLNRIDAIKPRPEMVTSIVVFSDGTDAISTQFSAEQIPTKANEIGVKIHTVWLRNVQLGQVGVDNGQGYLRSLAEQTGASSANLDNPGLVRTIWDRISSFGNHLAISYTLDEDNITPGEYDLEVSFPDSPGLPSAVTKITIANSIPTVEITIPEEDRTIQLASLDGLIPLKIPTNVRWLDGETRIVEAAQLYINGEPYQDIPIDQLSSFEAEVPLTSGENTFQIVLRDETGAQAQSDPITLTVTEGDGTVIPQSLGGTSGIWRILRWLLIALIVLAILWFALRYLMRLRNRPKTAPVAKAPLPVRATKEPVATTVDNKLTTEDTRSPYAPPLDTSKKKKKSKAKREPSVNSGAVSAKLEVLDSLSTVADSAEIARTEFLIGRSPTVDLSFPDDPTVSRIHATIVQDGAIFRIFDEQSTSGSYVNDREVPEYGLQLSDGDEVHLGAVHMRFRLQM